MLAIWNVMKTNSKKMQGRRNRIEKKKKKRKKHESLFCRNTGVKNQLQQYQQRGYRSGRLGYSNWWYSLEWLVEIVEFQRSFSMVDRCSLHWFVFLQTQIQIEPVCSYSELTGSSDCRHCCEHWLLLFRSHFLEILKCTRWMCIHFIGVEWWVRFIVFIQ